MKTLRRKRIKQPIITFNYKKIAIKKGDTVQVITGDYKGQIGSVMKIDRQAGRVFIEGIATVHRAVKKSENYPDGGFMPMIKSIHISNCKFISKNNNIIKLSDARSHR